MKTVYKCGDEIVNKHSHGVGNPFGMVIPDNGDFIKLGEHTEKFTHLEHTPMKKYVVISRTFSAIENYNNNYSDVECIIELEEVK